MIKYKYFLFRIKFAPNFCLYDVTNGVLEQGQMPGSIVLTLEREIPEASPYLQYGSCPLL